mmetsp:Transcript_2405/g.5948  ORF Transcript_2405/g.5948 Transcript_2405/m.5948 type:complete len:152 (+) Transcript_2405:249-704(+)
MLGWLRPQSHLLCIALPVVPALEGCNAHRVALGRSPGGCHWPQPHLLLTTYTAPSGWVGQNAHHRVKVHLFPGRPMQGSLLPHAYVLVTISIALLGFDGQEAHHRAELRSSPGSPRVGCLLPHSHFLVATLSASSALVGQEAHHCAEQGPC